MKEVEAKVYVKLPDMHKVEEVIKCCEDREREVVSLLHNTLENHGRRWTDEEEARLAKEMFYLIRLIAARHNRTPDGIRMRIKKIVQEDRDYEWL